MYCISSLHVIHMFPNAVKSVHTFLSHPANKHTNRQIWVKTLPHGSYRKLCVVFQTFPGKNYLFSNFSWRILPTYTSKKYTKKYLSWQNLIVEMGLEFPQVTWVCPVVWKCSEGQTDTQTTVANMHFASATSHTKCTKLLTVNNGGFKFTAGLL